LPARYSGNRPRRLGCDQRAWFAWLAPVGLDVLRRVHIELYGRRMEEQHLVQGTIGSRLSTVHGFYRFAVVDVVPHGAARRTGATPEDRRRVDEARARRRALACPLALLGLCVRIGI